MAVLSYRVSLDTFKKIHPGGPSTTIAYHESKPGVPCPDGIAAAAVAFRRYPHASEIIGLTYDRWRTTDDAPSFETGDRVVLVDYSVPADVVTNWKDAGAIVEITDHHRTAAADLSQWRTADGVWMDTTECGATLAWKRYFPDLPLPPWLRYVRDRDLWRKELPDSDAIHLGAHELGHSISLAYFLLSLTEDQLRAALLPFGRQALERRNQRVALLLLQFDREDLDSHTRIPTIRLTDPNDDALVSDLGNAACKQMPDAPFVAIARSDGHTWELRSIGDFDVSHSPSNTAAADIKTPQGSAAKVRTGHRFRHPIHQPRNPPSPPSAPSLDRFHSPQGPEQAPPCLESPTRSPPALPCSPSLRSRHPSQHSASSQPRAVPLALLLASRAPVTASPPPQ